MFFPGGPFGPAPLGMMPSHGNAYGKTRYNYVTPDGGPPMLGAVPSGSPFDPPKNPYGNCVPSGMHPYGLPSPFTSPPPPYRAMPPPNSWYCTPTPPPAYSCPPPPPPPGQIPPTVSRIPPPPPPPPANSDSEGAYHDAEEPLQGNRVNGQLATFPDRSNGYIFPKRTLKFIIPEQNVLRDHSQDETILLISTMKYRREWVARDMTIAEFIEQIDCIKRANTHHPYNQPGRGYPRHLIGVQELIRLSPGRFTRGSKIMLTDPQANSRLEDVWPAVLDSDGEAKPRYVVRLPV